MIILDTSVLSEPLRPRPAPEVVKWLDRQVVETLYLTTVSLAEVRFGIAALPPGARRTSLASRFDEEILPLFSGRVLPFDVAAAVASGDLRARAKAAGHGLGLADAMIAAVATVNHMTVATRDTRPFEVLGVEVIDPFGTR